MTTTGGRRANDAWEALLSAHAVLMKKFADEDLWHEVSMREYDVLYSLAKCRAPMRLGDLHHHVLLSQPALSRLVDRLVQRGFVERRHDPQDGRGVLLSLTDVGMRMQRQIGQAHGRSVARAVTERLTAEELQQLTAICQKLADTSEPMTHARGAHR